MTNLLTTDDANSGEVVSLLEHTGSGTDARLANPIVDTWVIEPAVDPQPTRPLTAHLRILPPTRALRLADAHPERAHDTGEFPLIATGAELVVAGRGYPPIGPSTPTTPRPNGPANPPTPPPPPPVRASRHRRRRTPWSPLARRALRCWVAMAVVELTALAVVAVLAVTR